MTDTQQPLVSIGVPLYNASRYLREALDALLAQDYPHLELIISDNASEDDTESICREYVARDARVQYHRSEQNRGAVWNFNRVFELSQGNYFMWAAFDDLRAPQYVRRCVEALEADSRAVMCSTRVRFIDEGGAAVEDGIDRNAYQPSGRTRLQRIRQVAQCWSGWYDFYGLIRRDVLTQTQLFPPVWGGDVVFTLELCLLGKIIILPEDLFCYRIFSPKKKTTDDVLRVLKGTSNPNAIHVSSCDLAMEMARAVWLSRQPWGARVLQMGVLLTNFVTLNRTYSLYIYLELPRRLKEAWGARNGRRLGALAVLALFLAPAAPFHMARLLADRTKRRAGIWRARMQAQPS